MPAKIDKNTFLQKLKNVHSGTIVRLKKPEYTKSDVKHRVKCLVCNHIWEASGYTLTNSKNPNGCPKCGRVTVAEKFKTPLKDFLKDLNTIHKGTILYVDGYTIVGAKANFKCKVCGNKWNTRCISLTKTNPHGCPKCADKNSGLLRLRTPFEIKQEIERCHGESIKVLRLRDKAQRELKVCCTICNHVWSPFLYNLIGNIPHGCPNCRNIKMHKAVTKPKDVFIQQLKDVHKGNIKLISEYSKQSQKLKFKCSKGHTWWTEYAEGIISPTRKQGCPHCGNIISKGEGKLFKFIKHYCPDAQQSVRIVKDPRTGGRLEWDIYVPSKKIAIEYNGVYFHSFPKKSKDSHLMKSQQSILQQGVRVIHITDLEWRSNTKVVKKTLKHLLGITNERYYARKLRVAKRSKLTVTRRTFYQKNHLQGDPTNGISYALLRADGGIVALMTFAPIQSIRGTVKKEGFYELVRYATKGSVVGGASRLFTAFLREYDPEYILSYSQNDWFDGGIYTLLGFTKVKELGPDYRTVWDGKLKHKSYTRRGNLQKLIGSAFNPRLTEHQNLINNEILIIYDSGKIKWEWVKL